MDAKSPKDLHYYEPAKGHGLRHDPFNAIIAPRPIGWISSRDCKGNDLADPMTSSMVVRVGLCQTLSRGFGRFGTGAAPRSQLVW